MLLTLLTGTLDTLGSQLVTFASDDDIVINADGIGQCYSLLVNSIMYMDLVLQVVAVSLNSSNEWANVTLPSLDSSSGLSYIELPLDLLQIAVMNNSKQYTQYSTVRYNFYQQLTVSWEWYQLQSKIWELYFLLKMLPYPPHQIILNGINLQYHILFSSLVSQWRSVHGAQRTTYCQQCGTVNIYCQPKL